MNQYDVAVIGAGLMGSAAAASASRRGRSVVLFEQFDIGHSRGSSHGSARIFRHAYADPLFVRMTGAARELWRELEIDVCETVMRMTGGLDFGSSRHPEVIAKHLAAQGISHELMDSYEACRRWPGIQFSGPVLYHPGAGTIDAAAAVDAFVSGARLRGVEVRERARVSRIVPSDGGVAVHTVGATVTARRVIVAAGAWVADLAGEHAQLPPLTVTQEQIFHFPRRDRSIDWPVFVHDEEPLAYGLPGGRDGGPGNAQKIGEHHGGTVTTAHDHDGMVAPESRGRVVNYVERWLPGLDPTPTNEATCLYTTTPSQDFILDSVDPIVVCSPCSGQGAKFAPLIGTIAADLADGKPPYDERFALSTHLDNLR